MPDARHSLLSQWSRKMGSQQSGGSEDMATILGNGTEASPSLARCAAPRLRGGGGSSVFTAAYGLIVDQDAPVSAAEAYGSSPMVGIPSSASAPVIDRRQARAGLNRDGYRIDRHGTDLHQGKPWRADLHQPPDPNYQPPAQLVQHAELHAGRRSCCASQALTAATPWDPDFGKNDPNPYAPHMRSSVDTLLYGRDLDKSDETSALRRLTLPLPPPPAAEEPRCRQGRLRRVASSRRAQPSPLEPRNGRECWSAPPLMATPLLATACTPHPPRLPADPDGFVGVGWSASRQHPSWMSPQAPGWMDAPQAASGGGVCGGGVSGGGGGGRTGYEAERHLSDLTKETRQLDVAHGACGRPPSLPRESAKLP